MLTIRAQASLLLIVDFQARLMPAIHEAEAAMANAERLIAAAGLLDVPILVTEQNAEGLGSTVPGLVPEGTHVAHKMTFDAVRAPGFLELVPEGCEIVVAGCEAHVCVLQTVLGLRDRDFNVYVCRDALGARRPENKEAAIRRMGRHGAEIVTTEMVLFEWLETADHPQFRDVIQLMK